MTHATLPAGTIHDTVPTDLEKVLLADQQALAAWHSITPLARNEWICWVEEPKLPATRERRVERTHTELAEGKRRPCCWLGCIHRTDKAISPSVQAILDKRQPKQS